MIGETIGDYQVERSIGRGGRGEVFLAKDTHFGRPVALKLLRVDFSSAGDRIRRFQQEARAVSALNHPNIVTIYEVAQSEDCQFIISEYIEGLTLREVINNFNPQRGMKLDQALEITMQVGSAIAVTHQGGIIHGNIKPENVMMRRDGAVKVLDFGMTNLSVFSDGPEVRSISLSGSTTGILLGAISYLSPEQVRGRGVDLRTDIFSLGVVLSEMMTGRKPFEGVTAGDVLAAILNSEPALISNTTSASARLQQVIGKALHKNRDERYASMGEMLKDLGELKAGLKPRSGQDRPSSTLSVAPEISESLIIPINSENEETGPIKRPASQLTSRYDENQSNKNGRLEERDWGLE